MADHIKLRLRKAIFLSQMSMNHSPGPLRQAELQPSPSQAQALPTGHDAPSSAIDFDSPWQELGISDVSHSPKTSAAVDCFRSSGVRLVSAIVNHGSAPKIGTPPTLGCHLGALGQYFAREERTPPSTHISTLTHRWCTQVLSPSSDSSSDVVAMGRFGACTP